MAQANALVLLEAAHEKTLSTFTEFLTVRNLVAKHR